MSCSVTIFKERSSHKDCNQKAAGRPHENELESAHDLFLRMTFAPVNDLSFQVEEMPERSFRDDDLEAIDLRRRRNYCHYLIAKVID
jgi:hypothetical protein